MNLFGTVLTYPAPSANYRGESELNRTVIQKVTDGRFDYAIISPEAMRNALREILAGYGLPCNRRRVHPTAGEGDEKQQLAVAFESFPDAGNYADDFLFGYLVAIKGKELTRLRKERGKDFPMKRDSVLRMNLAKSLEPYRHNHVLTQSPRVVEGWKVGANPDGSNSALLHRETVVSPFQYPFALNLNDCTGKEPWAQKLLQAIGELNGVSGNHARSYYEMAPASIAVRLTDCLVAGYETYGFKPKKKTVGYEFPEVVNGPLHDPPDYPASEFYLGGQLVKEMEDSQREALVERGATLERDPRKLLDAVAAKAWGG